MKLKSHSKRKNSQQNKTPTTKQKTGINLTPL